MPGSVGLLIKEYHECGWKIGESRGCRSDSPGQKPVPPCVWQQKASVSVARQQAEVDEYCLKDIAIISVEYETVFILIFDRCHEPFVFPPCRRHVSTLSAGSVPFAPSSFSLNLEVLNFKINFILGVECAILTDWTHFTRNGYHSTLAVHLSSCFIKIDTFLETGWSVEFKCTLGSSSDENRGVRYRCNSCRVFTRAEHEGF